jgi:hypothetical protein
MKPVETLYHWARRGNREYGLRVPTAEEAEALMAEWGTDKDATDIALNLLMVYRYTGTVDDEAICGLAKAVQRYGDERAEAAVERHQEWGE